VRGSLLGGAIGDALGAPVEFMSGADIERRFGPDGVRSFQLMTVDGVEARGLITDDTQMTLFTMEGIIRAFNRMNARGLGFTNSVIQHAYCRWADTQLYPAPIVHDGWLVQQQWLYSRRAPGQTCLSALGSGTRDVEQYGSFAVNNSKGCGAVMRSAPFGWLGDSETLGMVYEHAFKAASYTHGHPTGQVASGALAVLIAHIMGGSELLEAVNSTTAFLETQEHSQETLDALEMAVVLAADGNISRQTLETIGGGWIAEEALAISVYAALSYPRREQAIKALSLAVSHGGDSDSTGSIAGNILGALHGESWLPSEFVIQLEGRGTMLELADDFIYAWRDGYTPKDQYMSAGDAAMSPDGLMDTKAWVEKYPIW
jgi:ADP-ribosylglycohydrolase